MTDDQFKFVLQCRYLAQTGKDHVEGFAIQRTNLNLMGKFHNWLIDYCGYNCSNSFQVRRRPLKKRVSTYTLCATFLRLFSLQIPSFNGKSSHLIFAGLGQKSPLWNDFELVIRPTEDNGLILYNGDRSNPNGDFVAVFLSQGYIEFAFDAGDGATVVR